MIENFNLDFFLKYDIDSSDGGSIFMTPTGGCVKCAMLEACGYGFIGGGALRRGDLIRRVEGKPVYYYETCRKFKDISRIISPRIMSKYSSGEVPQSFIK